MPPVATSTAALELASLAAGLCQDADIRLEVSPANIWAWDPIRRVIIVSGTDLEKGGPEFCAGVLAHEVSHYYITRYNWFSVSFASFPILRFLLNAIEDPRVNTWIRRRYPGTSPWLQVVADTDMKQPHLQAMPAVLRFGFEAAREEWLGWQPAYSVTPLPAEVAQALDETRDARRAFAEILPPANLDPSVYGPDLPNRYRQEVWPALAHDVARGLPSLREQAIRLSVRDSLKLAEEKILPVARRLLKDDIDKIAEYLRDNAEAQKKAMDSLKSRDGQAIQELCEEAAKHSGKDKARPRVELKMMGLGLVEAWLDNWRKGNRDSPMADPDGRCECDRPFWDTEEAREARRQRRRVYRRGRIRPRKKTEEMPEKPPPGLIDEPNPIEPPKYEEILLQIAPQINELARIIEEELNPVKKMRERRGYPTGYKLDLRRLMKYHADLRDYNKLWLRKTLPERWSVVFSLLVDLSGSMAGEKIKAAVAGAILLAETLHRLRVPFLINGFQNRNIPFCPIGEGLTHRVRTALAEMEMEVNACRRGGNNCPSYNDDGPCVLAAADEVLELGFDERVLIVISDGLPEGEHSTVQNLHDAVAELTPLEPHLRLIGIGLGPDTDHVHQFYPHAVGNVPVDRFAAEIGGLLRRVLRAGRRAEMEMPD